MTSQSIVQLREQYPKISNAEIARKLGISRQAVWQHVKRLGLQGDNRGEYGWCLQCEIAMHKRARKFCSRECQIAYTRINLMCDVCGKQYQRRTKELLWRMQHPWSANGRTQQFFTCSVECRTQLTTKMLKSSHAKQHSGK